MSELGEATIRANMRRRAGGDPDSARVDRMIRSIAVVMREDRPRSAGLRRLATALSFRARVGLAAALILALALVAVPLTGSPSSSESPSGATSTVLPSQAPPSVASTPLAGGVQLLTLAELQRVVALGDQPPYASRVVVADIELVPRPANLTCGGTDDCPIGRVAASDPPIAVFLSAADTDLVQAIPAFQRAPAPVIVRIRGVDAIELVGLATLTKDQALTWSVPTFVRAADEMPRTMELRPDEFLVGPAFVVDGQLASGPGLFCTLETPSTARIAGFACGVTGWLAPAEIADPTAIIDGWTSRPADWVRVQNGSYQRFGQAEASPAGSGSNARRGFYVVFPVLKYNATKCFECDAGAVAVLYARLEPVPIP